MKKPRFFLTDSIIILRNFGYELLHEVMKQNELFDISMRKY